MRIIFLPIAFIAIYLILIFSGACSQESSSKRILETDGVTEIQMTGYRFLICSKDDTFSTGFIGKKNGKVVSGAVCSGIFKGNTIRYD